MFCYAFWITLLFLFLICEIAHLLRITRYASRALVFVFVRATKWLSDGQTYWLTDRSINMQIYILHVHTSVNLRALSRICSFGDLSSVICHRESRNAIMAYMHTIAYLRPQSTVITYTQMIMWSATNFQEVNLNYDLIFYETL